MKAPGLQGDALPEIIEILDDEADAFSGRAPSQTSADTGGPRWVGPVAALALVGLIGYGVASSSSSDSTPSAAPTPTTSNVPRTTQPAPTTTVAPLPPVPYYTANPPRQYVVQSAEVRNDQHVFYGGDSFQLWATEGASATTGSWVSIDSWEGAGPVYATSGYRQHVGDREIAITRTAGGAAAAQFTTSPQVSVALTSFGLDDDHLLQLVASITETDGHVAFGDPALLAGYQLLSTVQPWVAIQGEPAEQVQYGPVDDPSQSFVLAVAPYPGSVEDGVGGPADRQVALRFMFSHSTPFMADGHPAVGGAMLGSSGYAMASWIAGDHVVTISGNMTEQQLISIARTVHQVSSAEWQGMQFQAAKNIPAMNDFTDYQEGLALTVSSGTDAAGDPWTVRVANATFGAQRQLSWKWAGNGGTSIPDESPQITTIVDQLRTYVLADLPRSVAATADLHVVRPGLDPVITPFVDVDPTIDRTFAAYAFSETGPYTAQIVGGDGTVLASWPSS